MLGENTGTINLVIASEAACAREAGYGDLHFICWRLARTEMEPWRSDPVLGLETGTISLVIAREHSDRGDLPFIP